MARLPSSIFGAAMLQMIACASESTVHLQTDGDGPKGNGTPAVDTADTGNEASGSDSGGGSTDSCKDDHPVIEIGTGESVFEGLHDGDDIEVIHGAQDGHHLLGSIRTRNTTSVAAIRFDITPDYSGESISTQTYRIQLLPDPSRGDCAWIMTGLFAYLGRIDPAGAPFLGQTAVMRMDLVDDDGREASAEVSVVPFLPAIMPG